MADRRDFLKGILTVSGLAMTPVFSRDIELPEEVEADTTSYPAFNLKYKGFSLYWTGWKHVYNQDILVGQWCAYGENYPKDRCFYASYPGDARQYWPGQLFDISIKEGQDIPVWGTSLEKKKQYMLETLQRLMALIDSSVGVA